MNDTTGSATVDKNLPEARAEGSVGQSENSTETFAAATSAAKKIWDSNEN